MENNLKFDEKTFLFYKERSKTKRERTSDREFCFVYFAAVKVITLVTLV
jgi:hypothetical protein